MNIFIHLGKSTIPITVFLSYVHYSNEKNPENAIIIQLYPGEPSLTVLAVIIFVIGQKISLDLSGVSGDLSELNTRIFVK